MLTGSSGKYPYRIGRHLKVVLDLYVYADESGTDPRDKVCLVGGHIGSPRQWGRFNGRWRSILASEGVDEFHARDFFQRRMWQSTKSPYHDWTTTRGDAFLTRLVESIASARIFPVACAVPHAVFEAQGKDMRQLVTGGQGVARLTADGSLTSTLKGGAHTRPYQAAMMVTVIDAINHAKPGAVVHFVFDEHDEYAPFAQQHYALIKRTWPAEYARKLGGISYESSRDHPEIQVADLYCYLQARALVRPEAVTRPQLEALRVLNKRRPEGIMVHTAEVYESIRQRMGAKVLEKILREAEAQASSSAAISSQVQT